MASETHDDDDEAGGGGGGDDDDAARGRTARWFEGASPPGWVRRGLGLYLPMAVLVFHLWVARSFTIDDAFISFRYARNFARGLGLVYNAGEAIEGYTNFLWTVLLAGGVPLGIDPEVAAKGLGALSAVGSLGLLYALSARLRPFGWFPCIATWLFATSVPNVGYAVWGLETGFFVCFLLLGTWLFLRERDAAATAFPFSGLAFAVAGLARPEAPMFLGLLMLFTGRDFFRRQNLLRAVVFVVPLALHMAWRHGFYGSWLPNTLSAKTGNLSQQLRGGADYLDKYVRHAGILVWLGAFGVGYGVARRHRWVLAFAVIALAVVGYVALVGGDWMPFFRFMATFEAFAFLLVGVGMRTLAESAPVATSGRQVAGLTVVLLLLVGFSHRVGAMRGALRKILDDEKVFWDSAAGGAAEVLRSKPPGTVAIADIGQLGYRTDYPVLDLLGLVDPVISKLPGGYTNKTGPGYVDRVFEVMPRYFVLVGRKNTCTPLQFPGQEVLRRDPRFRDHYVLGGKVTHSKGGLWCIFERKDP
ncbi:MAG: hypothetical protein AAF928_05295 [Myxococcota bacterium]